jgi:hypothetical protein
LDINVVRSKVEKARHIMRKDITTGHHWWTDDNDANWDEYWGRVKPTVGEYLASAEGVEWSAPGAWREPLRYEEKAVPASRGKEEEVAGSEFITYRNVDGYSYSEKGRVRDFTALKSWKPDDLEVGSLVAFRRNESGGQLPAGYDTPFYMGFVVAVRRPADGGAAGTSSEVLPGKTIVTVHHVAPFYRHAATNDIEKKWRACCRTMKHEWNPVSCPKICKRACEGEDPKFEEEIELSTIFETHINLTVHHHVKAESKRRLAEQPKMWAETSDSVNKDKQSAWLNPVADKAPRKRTTR